MKYNIKEINLWRYGWIIILSVISSITISFFLISSKLIKEIIFIKQYTFIIYTILNFIFSYILIQLLKKYYTRNIGIVMNKEEFILNNNIIFPFKDIDSFEVETLFTNYPSFKIKMKDNYKFKFNCYNKVDNNFESFVNKLNNSTKIN